MHNFPCRVGPWFGEFLISEQRLLEKKAIDTTLETEEDVALQMRLDYSHAVNKYAERLPAQVANLLESSSIIKPLRFIKCHGHSSADKWLYFDSPGDEGSDIVPFLMQQRLTSSGLIISCCNPAAYRLPDLIPAIYPLGIINIIDVTNEEVPIIHNLPNRGKLETIRDFMMHVYLPEALPPAIKKRQYKRFRKAYSLVESKMR
ncbi:MAG: hypothetical protein AABW79_03245 [Nanoarchaeota archaeon]